MEKSRREKTKKANIGLKIEGIWRRDMGQTGALQERRGKVG